MMQNRQGDDEGQDTPRSEWIVAAVSALLILGVLGFLVYDGVTVPDTPPDVRVRLDSVHAGKSGYIALYTAHNFGGSTAAAVRVVGQLRPAGDTASLEQSEVTLSFVPGRSSRRGGLFFTRDPRRYRLSLRADGFHLP